MPKYLIADMTSKSMNEAISPTQQTKSPEHLTMFEAFNFLSKTKLIQYIPPMPDNTPHHHQYPNSQT